MPPPVVARSIADDIDNLLTFVNVKIRLQICGGLPDELGIASADWVLLFEGTQILTGRTAANGEISFIMFPSETLTLRVFDTDYTITLVDAYQAGTVTAGFQKRLDTLGYMTGYLLTPRGTAVPDDGTDGVRTRQAILNYQTDKPLAIDSVAGGATTNGLIADAGA